MPAFCRRGAPLVAYGCNQIMAAVITGLPDPFHCAERPSGFAGYFFSEPGYAQEYCKPGSISMRERINPLRLVRGGNILRGLAQSSILACSADGPCLPFSAAREHTVFSHARKQDFAAARYLLAPLPACDNSPIPLQIPLHLNSLDSFQSEGISANRQIRLAPEDSLPLWTSGPSLQEESQVAVSRDKRRAAHRA